ncbi:hypothetical protein ACIQMY_24885 [Streptomyces sp. NPDC091368]|uniref:hypothetical protein n=1 Tax=Streptomyces sp. NPDC091368 TaxID=3365993 RepID=UPI0038223157
MSITGPAGAPPETAAIRFVALLPAGWHAEISGLQENAAHLRIAAPTDTTPAQAAEAATGILSRPGLQGWQLVDD